MEKTLHVLGLSGGKDSAALAMYMRDNYPELDIQYYFTDTGKELPEVIDFVDRLAGYVGEIVDPYEEVFSSNREKKDFDYHLRQHKNYLPSPQARWCTIQMKLVPFEKWIQMKMEKEGYTKVVSYVGIRADEPAREGFLTNTVTSEYLTIKMPFREDGRDRDDIFEILEKADLLGDDTEVASYRSLSIDQKTCEPRTPEVEEYKALAKDLLSNRVEIREGLKPVLELLTILWLKASLIVCVKSYVKFLKNNKILSIVGIDNSLIKLEFSKLKAEWTTLCEGIICQDRLGEFDYTLENFLHIRDVVETSSHKDISGKHIALERYEYEKSIQNYISELKEFIEISNVEEVLTRQSISSIATIKNIKKDYSSATDKAVQTLNSLEKFRKYSYLERFLDTLELFIETQDANEEIIKDLRKLSIHFEANLTPQILLDILEAKNLGKPGYYGWRSRSGCTFCFYQQKIEWLRLKEIYPQAFEEAKSYEKKAEEDRGDGTFYWLGKATPLSSLESETRKVEIIENHELRVKRLEKKLNRRANLLRAKVKISDTERMDEIYDEVEGGGACVTCYK